MELGLETLQNCKNIDNHVTCFNFSQQLWMLLYLVRNGQEMFDVQLDEDIPGSLLKTHINMVVHGTNKKYADSFYTVKRENLVR